MDEVKNNDGINLPFIFSGHEGNVAFVFKDAPPKPTILLYTDDGSEVDTKSNQLLFYGHSCILDTQQYAKNTIIKYKIRYYINKEIIKEGQTIVIKQSPINLEKPIIKISRSIEDPTNLNIRVESPNNFGSLIITKDESDPKEVIKNKTPNSNVINPTYTLNKKYKDNKWIFYADFDIPYRSVTIRAIVQYLDSFSEESSTTYNESFILQPPIIEFTKDPTIYSNNWKFVIKRPNNQNFGDIVYQEDNKESVRIKNIKLNASIDIRTQSKIKTWIEWNKYSSEVVEQLNTVRDTLIAPYISFDKNKVVFTNNEPGSDLYYTLDGTIPTKQDKLYTGENILLNKNTTIKAIVYIDNFYSPYATKTFFIKKTDINVPKINLYGNENIDKHNDVVKCYVDIIFNSQYEVIKTLNNISYILNAIIDDNNIISIPEQVLNKEYSGDEIIIYTDKTNSGILDLKVDNINKFNDFKYPYLEKGRWQFNYFRNNITQKVTKKELENYVHYLRYNPTTRTYYIEKLSIDKLLKANNVDDNNQNIDSSDNRSLIYGKYIVIRFIFDNNKRIKLETLDISLENY